MPAFVGRLEALTGIDGCHATREDGQGKAIAANDRTPWRSPRPYDLARREGE